MKNKKNYVPLKDLCNDFKQDIVDGPFGSNLKRADYKKEGIPVLKIQNVKPFQIILKKMDYVDDKKFVELKRHSYTEGDIIMTKLGDPLGASAIVDGIADGLVVADLVRIRAQKIDTKYLCYHLNSPNTNDYINSLQKGTTRPRVRIKNVRDLPIYAPPIPEQKRIVAVLDETFAALSAARANAEKNLSNARELFEAVQQSIFKKPAENWFERRLDNICENLDSKRIPVTKRDRKEGPFPYYGASGIVDYVDDYIFDEDLLLVSEDGANLLARTYPIAFSITGKTWVNNHAHVLRFENMATQKFVEYYLNSIPLDDYVSGMAQPKLNQKMLNSIVIALPPTIDEQRAIVAKLDALSAETKRLEMNYQRKLSALEELEKSVLERAFDPHPSSPKSDK
jgi:type I restriction enzyme S subunit